MWKSRRTIINGNIMQSRGVASEFANNVFVLRWMAVRHLFFGAAAAVTQFLFLRLSWLQEPTTLTQYCATISLYDLRYWFLNVQEITWDTDTVERSLFANRYKILQSRPEQYKKWTTIGSFVLFCFVYYYYTDFRIMPYFEHYGGFFVTAELSEYRLHQRGDFE